MISVVFVNGFVLSREQRNWGRFRYLPDRTENKPPRKAQGFEQPYGCLAFEKLSILSKNPGLRPSSLKGSGIEEILRLFFIRVSSLDWT